MPTTIYRSVNYSVDSFKVLHSLWKESKLCDVTLCSGESKIEAHRIILAACSPYFCDLFTSDQLESKQTTVTLREIGDSTLRTLVNYVYTAEIEISESNVQALLPAASLLLLQEVRQNCCEFLLSQLHPSNCLGFRRFGGLHGCIDLKDKAYAYALANFADVIKFDEFLSLSVSEVCELISDDSLWVTCEEQATDAALRWLQQDPDHRKCYTSRLMSCVRLPLLPKDYLVNLVDSEPLIDSNLECKELIIEAMKYHLLPDYRKVTYLSPRTKPRKYFSRSSVLFVIGGQGRRVLKSVERFNHESNAWIDVTPMVTHRCRAGIAVVDGLIYAVGGHNGSREVRTVDSYDPIKDVWQSVASMVICRSTLGTAGLNGNLYAVGGVNGPGNTALDSVECYSPSTNSWRCIHNMNTRRSNVGVASLDGYLYAVGGYDGYSQVLKSVERYDPITDEWTFIREMNVRRSGAAVAVLHGLLYAIGGNDGPDIHKSAEFYDPTRDDWTTVADMNFNRRYAAATTADGLVLVFGGDDGAQNLNSVECYDSFCDKWEVKEASLITGRSQAGAATMELPNHIALSASVNSDCESNL